MTDKPTTAAGYRAEETGQVIAACLTLAGALGDLDDELCIVGGLVPSMICDTPVDPSALDSGAHVGTNDLDVALEVSVLDDEHYKEIASRLRGKDFAPDTRETGAIVRQRWRWRDQKVTVDFLIPPSAGTDPDEIRVQNLEHDFAALVVKPLGLAFHELVPKTLKGHTLEGDLIERTVAFCGPAAFVALKAYAYSKRNERKDAYDLVYVLRRWPNGILDIADRMSEHATRDARRRDGRRHPRPTRPRLRNAGLRRPQRCVAVPRQRGRRRARRRCARRRARLPDTCAERGITWARRHGER